MVLNLQGFNASIKARPIYIRDLRRKNTEWWRPNDATKNDDVYHDNDDNNNKEINKFIISILNFEITVDHCNLIGFQQLDLFMNQTILLQRYIASFLFKKWINKTAFLFLFSTNRLRDE